MAGGAVRNAANIAGLGAGYRPPISIAGAARRALPPPSSTATAVASGEMAAAPAVSLAPGDKPAGVAQWPAWESDDWEFTGWKSDDSLELTSPTAMSPRARLVFGPAPTIEEAKEATSDLKEALEKVYFSETQLEVLKEEDQGHHNIVQSSIIPVMRGHVAQAFTLLQTNSEAQNVVASLASDKKIWDAVMKNEKVIEFYRNHQSSLIETVAEDALSADSPEKFDDPSAEKPLSETLSDFVDNVKKNVTKNVTQLVSNVSNFFQDLFTPSEARAGTSSGTERNNHNSFFEKAFGGSFIAIAIAVIMVVLVKRG